MTMKTKPLDFEIDKKGCFNIVSHASNTGGYSAITINGIRKIMHRHVYEEMFGFIPKGLVVRHKCDNPRCINPEHLELGTQADNVRDIYDRNRDYDRNAENNPAAKLLVDQVIEIKKSLIAGIKGNILAEKFGVTTTLINKIKKGDLWETVVVDAEEKIKMQTNSNKKRLITIKGETKTLSDWCKTLNIKYGTVSSRISRGMSDIEALIK